MTMSTQTTIVATIFRALVTVLAVYIYIDTFNTHSKIREADRAICS